VTGDDFYTPGEGLDRRDDHGRPGERRVQPVGHDLGDRRVLAAAAGRHVHGHGRGGELAAPVQFAAS
jgi:hypothetical protein